MRQRTPPGSIEIEDDSEIRTTMIPFDRIETEEDLRVREENKKKKTFRLTLFLIGTGLFLIGLGIAMWKEGHKKVDYLSAIILGTICLVPGTYAAFLFYGTKKKWPGYDVDGLISYEEEEDQS